MDAIEIFNAETGYSPESHEWCLKHNLAIMGCSDSHAPFFTNVDYKGDKHRIVTLLFAKERSAEGVREAIESRRTAVFGEDVVYGREQELRPLLEACLKVKRTQFKEKEIIVEFENVSSIPVTLTKGAGSEDTWYDRYKVIPPFSTFTFKVRPNLIGDKQPAYDKATKSYTVNFVAENYYIGPNKPLAFSVTVTR